MNKWNRTLTNCCLATQKHFSKSIAEEDLARYRQQGPDKTTRILIHALKETKLQNCSLLDIGGGIGVIPLELCAIEITNAVLVDIASSYLLTAEEEAQRRGLHHKLQFVEGDFVQLHEQLPEADLVTLDRVVCCYPMVEPLVKQSVAKCRQWYALSFPTEQWYSRLYTKFKNWRRHRQGDSFRTYIHSENLIDSIVKHAGFERTFRQSTLFWIVAIYHRSRAA